MDESGRPICLLARVKVIVDVSVGPQQWDIRPTGEAPAPHASRPAVPWQGLAPDPVNPLDDFGERQQSGEDVKILVVHGDREAGEAYRLELEQSGDSVWVAEDRDQAVTWAELAHPDAIVVSLRPPGAAGLALLDELRADDRTSDIPLVIVSELDERELARRGVTLRATDFVVTRPRPRR